MKEENTDQITSESFFSNLKDLIVDYIEERFELTRLVAIEKTAILTATVITYTIVGLLAFLILIFCGLLLGFYLNQLFKSYFISFSLVTFIYIGLFIGVLIFKNKIKHTLLNNLIKTLLSDENS